VRSVMFMGINLGMESDMSIQRSGTLRAWSLGFEFCVLSWSGVACGSRALRATPPEMTIPNANKAVSSNRVLNAKTQNPKLKTQNPSLRASQSLKDL
jgi:hypothetical protein